MKKIVSLLVLSLMSSTTYGKAINFDELVQQDIPTIKGRLKEKIDQYGNSKRLYKELAGLYTTKAAFLGILSRLEPEQIPYLNEPIFGNYIPAINRIRELKGSPEKMTAVHLQRSEKEEKEKEKESERTKEGTKERTKGNILPNLLKAGKNDISSWLGKAAKKAEAYKKAHAAMTLQSDHLEALAKLPDEELMEGINLRLEYLKKFDADLKNAKKEGGILFDKNGHYLKKVNDCIEFGLIDNEQKIMKWVERLSFNGRKVFTFFNTTEKDWEGIVHYGQRSMQTSIAFGQAASATPFGASTQQLGGFGISNTSIVFGQSASTTPAFGASTPLLGGFSVFNASPNNRMVRGARRGRGPVINNPVPIQFGVGFAQAPAVEDLSKSMRVKAKSTVYFVPKMAERANYSIALVENSDGKIIWKQNPQFNSIAISSVPQFNLGGGRPNSSNSSNSFIFIKGAEQIEVK